MHGHHSRDSYNILEYITERGVNIVKGCVKLFPPKTRADVGMVQCVAEGHGKPPGRKNIDTRRASPCKEEGQPVHAKPRSSVQCHFGLYTICYGQLQLHGLCIYSTLQAPTVLRE